MSRNRGRGRAGRPRSVRNQRPGGRRTLRQGRGRAARPRSVRNQRPGGRRTSRQNSSLTDRTRRAEEPTQNVDIEMHPKDFFVGVVSTAEHAKAQEKNRSCYAAALAVLQKNGVAIAQNSRIRALAMAWARNDHELADALLKNRSQFGLPEVLKAIQLLDSGRQVRVLEKKLKRLQLARTKVSAKKNGKIKSDIDNMTALKPPIGSASGSVCKHVAQWVRGFSTQELEFYALHLPKEPWKKLADICHFNPEKDFAALPWFLPFCFGKDAPEGTMVNRCRDLTADNVNKLVVEFDIPYSHIKQLKDHLTEEAKLRIVEYEEKLDAVLWYYEDLQCKVVDEVIERRLAAKELVMLPTGKLLERLLTFKMIRDNIDARSNRVQGSSDRACFLPTLISLAEPRLTSIRLPLEAPIVVIGDKSGSMGVAIRTSTIIASLLTAITSARLVFFNTQNHIADPVPETVEQVLEVAVTTRAEGGTAPAASLWPFYERKEVVKTFIMVTDEEENSECSGFRFAPLYQKYCDEVYPARLVFVSFLRYQHAQGQMVQELKELGYNPLQFSLEGSRPDLSKLDNLFGLLSAESATFDEELAATEKRIKEEGLAAVYDALKSELKDGDKD